MFGYRHREEAAKAGGAHYHQLVHHYQHPSPPPSQAPSACGRSHLSVLAGAKVLGEDIDGDDEVLIFFCRLGLRQATRPRLGGCQLGEALREPGASRGGCWGVLHGSDPLSSAG